MGLGQPDGRIIQNTAEGSCGEVNDLDRNDYILINRDVCRADRPREYHISGTTIKINQFGDTINYLSKKQFS